MTMPFYVAPEQVMKDRAEYAQKGIARGRSLVGHAPTTTASLIVAENPSRTLHKISEIYDRIAFAGVGQVQRVRPAAGGRGPPRRHQGLRLSAARTSTPGRWPTSTPSTSARSSPTR